jgi:hypothetical protein
MTGRQRVRHCSRCARFIKHDDLVVFSGSKSFHYGCFVQRRETPHPIDAFLRRYYPSGFCVRCLSRSLRLTHKQVRNVVKASPSGRRLVVLLGARCAGCRRSRLTVQAVAYRGAS